MKLNTTLPRVWNARRRAKTYAEHRGNPVKHGIKSLCDNTPNVHFGGHEYASTFGPRMVLVRVDPADLVCVPFDCSQGKVRVCRYWVLKEVPNETQVPLFYNTEPEVYEDEPDEDKFPNGKIECGDCGTYCDADDKFCRGCGSAFVPKKCPECGNERLCDDDDEWDRFCSKCGYDYETD